MVGRVNLILFGPPGAGKGTQAQYLVKKYKYYQLSTGDLLRDEIENKTNMGSKISEIIGRGEMVTDEIVDYLNSPPTVEELKSLAMKMGVTAKDFIRSKESIFTELDLKPHLDNDAILYKHMSANPRLIERPIVVKGNKAVLGRPPEKVRDFLIA